MSDYLRRNSVQFVEHVALIHKSPRKPPDESVVIFNKTDKSEYDLYLQIKFDLTDTGKSHSVVKIEKDLRTHIEKDGQYPAQPGYQQHSLQTAIKVAHLVVEYGVTIDELMVDDLDSPFAQVAQVDCIQCAGGGRISRKDAERLYMYALRKRYGSHASRAISEYFLLVDSIETLIDLLG